MTIFLLSIFLMGFSGFPAYLLRLRAEDAQRLATAMTALGGLLGLIAVVVTIAGGTTSALDLAWGLPGSSFAVAVDPLSAVFLLPVFIVPVLSSVYGLGYWRPSEHCENWRRVGLASGLLAGAMAMVAIARDGILFLIAWEIMALAAYFAAAAEDDKPEVQTAGWIYLVATHAGTLCLMAMFACWRRATGSFALVPSVAFEGGIASTIFLLGLIGFGFKAGLMPLHIWLPGAHANAPSHVSAVMSGVMLKMGVYGIVRMTSLIPHSPLWWGVLLLVVGVCTSVAGIAFAIGQHDLKRILAYSSIENIGIIAIGMGLALIGRTQDEPVWVLLGLGGALFHVWNHSLFKPLLFFNAGVVIHATGTRMIDHMGGLARRLPRMMPLFAIGACAICALPPLNGFASEILIYLGLFRSLGQGTGAGMPAVALAAVALALTGALAVACFMKVLGAVFLGEPRSEAAANAGHHAPSRPMVIPMLILATACLILGLLPLLAAPLLDAAVGSWAPQASTGTLAALVPFRWLTVTGLSLVALTSLTAFGLKLMTRKRSLRHGLTWDCGYAHPAASMQYTGSSLGESLVTLAAFFLRPHRWRPVVQGIFPEPSSFESHVPDTVFERLAMPLCRAFARRLPRLRLMQQGQTHLYILYILIALIALLVLGVLGA